MAMAPSTPPGDASQRAVVIGALASLSCIQPLDAESSPAGLEVRRFDSAEALISGLRESPPAVVIIEAALAEAGAEALIAKIRRSAKAAPVRLIVVVSEASEPGILKALRAGADEVVCDPDELVARVRWQVESARRTDPVAGAGRRGTIVRELEQTRDFLSNLIEASPDAIVAAGRDGRIVLFNRAAEAILGWSTEEALGMSVRELYPPGGAEEIMGLLRSEEHGGVGRLASGRHVLCDHKGRQIPVEISAGILYEEGREAATVGIFTDLREHLHMQEKLEEATESLERHRRKALLAELAGAAAHELNQPLTSLLGYAELLDERLAEDDPNRRPASIILREGNRIADIVRKIGRITSYRTKEYVAGAKIVDLDASLFDSDGELDGSQWLEGLGESADDEDSTHES